MAGKPRRKPSWVQTQHDPSEFRLSAAEQMERHLAMQSPNLERARAELAAKRVAGTNRSSRGRAQRPVGSPRHRFERREAQPRARPRIRVHHHGGSGSSRGGGNGNSSDDDLDNEGAVTRRGQRAARDGDVTAAVSVVPEAQRHVQAVTTRISSSPADAAGLASLVHRTPPRSHHHVQDASFVSGHTGSTDESLRALRREEAMLGNNNAGAAPDAMETSQATLNLTVGSLRADVDAMLAGAKAEAEKRSQVLAGLLDKSGVSSSSAARHAPRDLGDGSARGRGDLSISEATANIQTTRLPARTGTAVDDADAAAVPALARVTTELAEVRRAMAEQSKQLASVTHTCDQLARDNDRLTLMLTRLEQNVYQRITHVERRVAAGMVCSPSEAGDGFDDHMMPAAPGEARPAAALPLPQRRPVPLRYDNTRADSLSLRDAGLTPFPGELGVDSRATSTR